MARYQGHTTSDGGFRMHHDKHESKKSSGGHKDFGKAHGGSEGISSKLLHSPMSKKMTPKGGGKQLSGKTKGY